MTSTATTEPAGRPPRRVTTVAEVRRETGRWRAAGLSVGLVPTMGALHDGHRSLLRRARQDCDRVVASIFVNPAQFGPGEDLAAYPRTEQADLLMLRQEGTDLAWLPRLADVYPPGFATTVTVGGPVTSVLEGAARPGHFDGVATVVAKLLTAVRPDTAYFGAKDAQQCAVVSRLASDLDTGTDIVVCPVVRDADGLALSSRNAYLSAEERSRALALPEGLARAARMYASGEREASALRRAVEEAAALSPSLHLDYVAVVDPDSFAVQEGPVGPGCRVVVAARMGRARLLDTLRLGYEEPPAVGRDAGRSVTWSHR